MLPQYINILLFLIIFFYFVMVMYLQILAYNKEKKIVIHLFIQRISSQRLNIKHFHSDMIF